jgi:prephenate dehydrogenase
MSFEKITVLGLGKIGGLAARLLHGSGFKVTGVDNRAVRASYPFDVRNADLGSQEDLKAVLAGAGAVLSCLPII